MMKRIISYLALIIMHYSVYAQTDYCENIVMSTSNAMILSNVNQQSPLQSYMPKVFFHLIYKNDGTGDVSVQDINSAFQLLQDKYYPYGICLKYAGYDIIKNDLYYTTVLDQNAFGYLIPLLKNVSYISDAINIYVLPYSYPTSGGSSEDIVANSLAIGGTRCEAGISTKMFLSNILVHEFGHCLGLEHTFKWTGLGGLVPPNQCPASVCCAEAIDGSNCTTCGDQTCDTPADKYGSGIRKHLTSNCEYRFSVWDNNILHYECGGTIPTGVLEGSPTIKDNYMSYAHSFCMNMFSNQQVIKMRKALDYVPTLMPLEIQPNLNYFIQNKSFSDYSNVFYSAKKLLIGNAVTTTPNGNVLFNNKNKTECIASQAVEINYGTQISPSSNSSSFSTTIQALSCNPSSQRFMSFKSIAENDRLIMYAGNSIEDPDYFYVYYRQNDTIINGKSYFFYRGFKHYYDFNNNTLVRALHATSGIQDALEQWMFIREQNDGKVFITHNNTLDEVQIFDYAWQIGDSIKQGIYITNIELVNYYGVMRRKYTYANSSGGVSTIDFFIEGIGFSNTMSGRFADLNSLRNPFESYVCASNNGQTTHYEPILFNNSITINCDDALIAGVQEFNQKKFSLYPNPANNTIFVQSNEFIKQITVYNTQGVAMPMEMEQQSNSNVQLDIRNYPNGVYIVVAQTAQGIQTQKFIKQ